MNIHPIVVHFAIALITLYGVAELIRFRKITTTTPWFYIKLFLVGIGALASYVALLTGDIASEGITDRSLHTLVETHESVATAIVIFNTIIALLYIVRWINKDFSTSSWRIKMLENKVCSTMWVFCTRLAYVHSRTSVSVVVALVSLVLITATGALGAAIVYGPSFDPFVSFIYRLFIH